MLNENNFSETIVVITKDVKKIFGRPGGLSAVLRSAERKCIIYMKMVAALYVVLAAIPSALMPQY